MTVAFIGGILIAITLIIGTYWMGKNASRDTVSAVRNVSLLYLDELTGRREQVVASTLSGYIDDLDVAVGMIEKEDLSSLEKLQAYQARMKLLYNLEKFAFVDENGLIYTSRGTRTDIDLYSFDYKTLSSAEISLKNPESDDIKVIVAIPVDNLPFGDTHLLVCFMEMDMDHFLSQLSLQSGTNSTTFCNIYTSEGLSLSNKILGGLASENNLLSALENADFEEGYNLERVRQDFSNRVNGVVSFTYSGIRETMCYVPINGTDWMLTYLIRESIVSEQINAITENIIIRSVIQSLITALVLTSVFIIMIVLLRRSSKLAMERETAEMLQQELEERIALQDELLSQEKASARQDNMITALASDYRSVYYVDLDTNSAVCYRGDDNPSGQSGSEESFSFNEYFTSYAEKYVDPEYLDAFRKFIQPENIREKLKKEVIIALRYLVHRDGVESYEMLRMADVNHDTSSGDNVIHAVGVGFTDIDAEMRDTLSKNQALVDALKAAEEASKAKTVFLSSMSHEIRTPMNAIIGLDSLALHEPDVSDKVKDYLEKIGTSAQHLLSLINDILDMSRIESGKMTLKNEEFAFSKLIEQINSIFSSQCREKGISYDCHIKGKLSDHYIGDSTKLRQVIINILSNAVKFTPAGGRVSFITEKTAAFNNRSTLKFTISDTGIGMNPEFIPRLFDSFSQEDSSSTNRYGSSGLGMAITKSIVDMMNGEISVESEKGVGTTFTLVITLTDSDKHSSAGETERPGISTENLSVLVIDDDPVACDHARLILDEVGIKSDTALSGEKALEMIKLRHARQNPYNFIIVDWHMPEMDGVETTRQIRSLIGDESAIIILTAYNWEDIFDEASSAGVDSFISKPLFSENLLEEFKKALKNKSGIVKTAQKKAELKGRRILLAEDMSVNAEIMKQVLEMREISSDLAENGKVAVSLFSSSPEGYYDAILMDIRMPEMDGIQATAAIRGMERPDAKNIPIIALTANAFDEDVQRSLQAGLNAHLSKPVEPGLLFETLESLIKN